MNTEPLNEPFPAMLHIAPPDAEKERVPWAAIAWFVGGVIGATALVATGRIAIAVCVLLAKSVIAVWLWPRAPRFRGILMSVAGGRLDVRSAERLRSPLLHVALSDLADVTRETRLARMPSPSTVMERYMGLDMEREVEIGRVVFNCADGSDIPLTEGFVESSQCTRWLEEIRVFLRLEGWLPSVERHEDGGILIVHPIVRDGRRAGDDDGLSGRLQSLFGQLD